MILSNDKNDQLKINEKLTVEDPFLDQLEEPGWEVIRLQQNQDPADSFRTSFDQVILRPKLEAALRRINPFLHNEQVEEVIRRLTNLPHTSLIENNQAVLRLLLENTSVARNHNSGQKSPTVRYIDFRPGNLDNNSFTAICQFKVRIPGTDHHIVPDIVLFLNGLPVGIIECKSPKVKEPIAEAIDQLLRYSQQRGAPGEGNPELFYTNQFLVATCRTKARFGTITTNKEKRYSH